MKKLSAALILLFGLATAALAQQQSGGTLGPTGIACAYNSVVPTITSGNFALVQCDSNGNLILSPTGGPSGPMQVQGNVASGATDSGNPVKVGGKFSATPPTFVDGQRGDLQLGGRGALRVELFQAGSANVIGSFSGGGATVYGQVIVPSSSAATGITSVVSASAEATHVLKASAGNLYSVYATNLTATPGFLVVLNATAAPADGAITPLECVPLPANANASVNYNPGPAAVFSTGITVVLTSAATCFTKTTGVITGFIKGSVQ